MITSSDNGKMAIKRRSSRRRGKRMPLILLLVALIAYASFQDVKLLRCSCSRERTFLIIGKDDACSHGRAKFGTS